NLQATGRHSNARLESNNQRRQATDVLDVSPDQRHDVLTLPARHRLQVNPHDRRATPATRFVFKPARLLGRHHVIVALPAPQHDSTTRDVAPAGHNPTCPATLSRNSSASRIYRRTILTDL